MKSKTSEIPDIVQRVRGPLHCVWTIYSDTGTEFKPGMEEIETRYLGRKIVIIRLMKAKLLTYSETIAMQGCFRI